MDETVILTGYQTLLYEGAQQRLAELLVAQGQLERLEHAVLVEALATFGIGSLSLVVSADEDRPVSIDLLLPYTSLATQQRHAQLSTSVEEAYDKYATLYTALHQIE